ncbi:MAG TPA: PEP-CTERM sorting domain-containing protein [Candidatus Angelobacter sp.]|jgi:hypothetical protein|nr:PEP-CTERM sorting domain-containing protein [Candidatus Angelobacter sp.]
MKTTFLIGALLSLAVCGWATPVDFQLNYSLGTQDVNAVLSTVDLGNGSYLVTGASGSYAGVPITGVFDPSLSGNVFAFNELLYFPAQPWVDIDGIVFELNGDPNIATGMNLYWDGAGYRSIDGGNNGPYVDVTLSLLGQPSPAAVPEPNTLMMFGSGIIGLAGILRRKMRG